MNIIGRIKTDFPQKFGLPRQSGLIDELKGEIIFEKEYANLDALRGLLDYSHIWILWEFSEAKREDWSPTVRPPRLGGDVRMGVFATRSPFRPNPIGLSVVKLDGIEMRKNIGPVLKVSGIDMMDDVKEHAIAKYGDKIKEDITGSEVEFHYNEHGEYVIGRGWVTGDNRPGGWKVYYAYDGEEIDCITVGCRKSFTGDSNLRDLWK